MRKSDLLFFADEIGFDQVDLFGSALPEQFCQRITEFYIKPAEECAKQNYAFAAGVLLVSCIDALSRIRFGTVTANRFKEAPRRKRFIKFVREELQSFSSSDIAERFYRDFRCGLVHQAGLKNGGQFSFQIGTTVDDGEGLIVVNPRLLATEVGSALRKYVTSLESDQNERAKLAKALEQDLAKDFSFARAKA